MNLYGNTMQIQTRTMYDYNHIHMMMSSPASSPPTLGYIQHPISKLDKLAGIAIKYGVVLFIFSFSSPFAKKNSPRTIRLNSFCVSLLPFPKEQRTNRLNSFVSPFSLVKEFKMTQSKNSFDSFHSLIQKCSKD